MVSSKKGFVSFVNNMYIYPTPLHAQELKLSKFLNGIYQVWIQSFPSASLVAIPMIKSSVYPTIYL